MLFKFVFFRKIEIILIYPHLRGLIQFNQYSGLSTLIIGVYGQEYGGQSLPISLSIIQTHKSNHLGQERTHTMDSDDFGSFAVHLSVDAEHFSLSALGPLIEEELGTLLNKEVKVDLVFTGYRSGTMFGVLAIEVEDLGAFFLTPDSKGVFGRGFKLVRFGESIVTEEKVAVFWVVLHLDEPTTMIEAYDLERQFGHVTSFLGVILTNPEIRDRDIKRFYLD